jgi:hypothetical protein
MSNKLNKTIVISSPLIDEKLSIQFTGKVLPLEHNGEIHIVLNAQAQLDVLFDEVVNARLGKPAIPILEGLAELQAKLSQVKPIQFNPNREERVRTLARMFYTSRINKGITVGDADGDWYLAEAFVDLVNSYAQPKESNAS